MTGTSNFRDPSWKHWLPPATLSGVRQEIREMVEHLFGDSLPQLRTPEFPRLDVVETADAVDVTSELPGFHKDQLQVSVDEKSLTISGNRLVEENPDEGRKYHRVERHSGSFSRTIWLPCPVNEAGIDAELRDGLLHIHLPKQQNPQRKTIEVKGAEPQPPSS